jgi:hypothetical protein
MTYWKMIVSATLVAIAPLSSWTEKAARAVQTGKGHVFACTDYSGKKVFLVSAEGKITWEYETGTCNDLWALPNGNLLFNTGKGAREVTRDKEVVFSYESESEIYACQRLANGNTFIGECNSGRLLEIAPDGSIVKEIKLLPEGADGGHVYMRNARKLKNGHYLVTHYGDQAVREYDGEGAMVREIPAPGGPHSVCRLPNGNTIIACGDHTTSATIFEVDPAGKVVWEIKNTELPGITLQFLTGFQRLPNGNTVLSNWIGHGHLGEEPHIIEVTPEKEVVWTFQDHKNMKTVSSVQILDVSGEVFH